jgi:hypothetical protein
MRDSVAPHPDGHSSDFSLVFVKARSALESAVLDLLSGDWEEGPRSRAHDMAVALRQAARNASWWDTESALRAVESLLALTRREALPIRSAVREKLLELFGLLDKAPASRSA